MDKVWGAEAEHPRNHVVSVPEADLSAWEGPLGGGASKESLRFCTCMRKQEWKPRHRNNSVTAFASVSWWHLWHSNYVFFISLNHMFSTEYILCILLHIPLFICLFIYGTGTAITMYITMYHRLVSSNNWNLFSQSCRPESEIQVTKRLFPLGFLVESFLSSS
jgi:hypothetical protein